MRADRPESNDPPPQYPPPQDLPQSPPPAARGPGRTADLRLLVLVAISLSAGILLLVMMRQNGSRSSLGSVDRREARRILFGAGFGRQLSTRDAAAIRSLRRTISSPASSPH